MNMKIVIETLTSQDLMILRNSQYSPKFLVSYKEIRVWKYFGKGISH